MKTHPYSKVFEAAFRHLLELEGGYSDDPDDRGGQTKYGISKRAHPDVDIPNLTLGQAKAIYWQSYWCANHCDKLSEPLALALFDGVVNHRAKVARKLLQLALSVNPDGILGPVTLSTAASADCKRVIARYFAGRANLYREIIAANSSQAKFAYGWFKRLFKVQQYILEECWPWHP